RWARVRRRWHTRTSPAPDGDSSGSLAIKTLPIAEVLFGKILVLLQFRRRLKISGGEDGLRCLLRARQMAGEPDRLARQKRRQAGEDARIEEEGLIVRSVLGDVVTLSPPLIISGPEIEDLFDRLARALDKTLDWATREQLRAA